jgi:hyaluronoglucosaminidase
MYRIDPETIDDPKDGICHSSPSDLAALVARYQQLWSIGIHTISVGWDDDAGTFVCAADTAKFGSDPSPEAAAQASVVTYVYQHFVATHPGARLVTVPSQYAGDVSTVYRTRLAALTPAAVQLFWTGPKVVSPTITLSDLNQASAAFGGRRLLIFDNYPVNDYVPNEEHLGPLVGRDPNLAGPAAGIMANEMREEEPSLISLFTIADYAWNAKAYDPLTSWSRSLAEFGGAGVGPLRGYAENSVNSWINTGPLSPVQPLIRDFVNAYTAGQSLAGPAARLTAALGAAAQAPAGIRAMVHDPAFVTESAPWLTKLADQANAGLAAVAGLLAQARGDHQTALTDLSRMNTFVAAGKAIPQYVAQWVYETLTTFASNEI